VTGKMAASLAGVLALSAALSPASAGAAGGRSVRFTVRGLPVRAVVPALFEPLLPGSFYPNRRKPRAWSGGPVVILILERSLARAIEPALLARGFLVAEVDAIDAATVDDLLEELARRVPGEIGETKLVARRAGNLLTNPRIRAAVLFDPPDYRETDSRSSACLPVALFHRAGPGNSPSAPPPGRPDCVSEKWYRSDDGFPEEALRDAAEWLASLSRPLELP